MRSGFAKPCKDAKIFVVLAKVFRFTKNFEFAKVSVYSEKLSSQVTILSNEYVNSEGSTELISRGKAAGEFSGRALTFLSVFLSQCPIFIQGWYRYLETFGNVPFGGVRNFCLIPHKANIRGYLGHCSGLDEFR